MSSKPREYAALIEECLPVKDVCKLLWEYFVGDEDALRLGSSFQLWVRNLESNKKELVAKEPSHVRGVIRDFKPNRLNIGYVNTRFRILKHHEYPNDVQLIIQDETTGIEVLQFSMCLGEPHGQVTAIHLAFDNSAAYGRSEFDFTWIGDLLAVELHWTTVHLRWESIEKLKLFTDHIKVAYPL